MLIFIQLYFTRTNNNKNTLLNSKALLQDYQVTIEDAVQSNSPTNLCIRDNQGTSEAVDDGLLQQQLNATITYCL